MQDDQSKKEEITREARGMREQMIGYVDAIVHRQDRYDILKRIETFQIEGASRNALRELVDHYTKMDSQNKEKIKEM